MGTWRGVWAAGVVGAAFLLSACGGAEDKAGDSGNASQQPPAASASPAAGGDGTAATGTKAEAVASVQALTTRTDPKLGPIVVDAGNRSVYRFDKDVPGSGSSACVDACATTWPAVTSTSSPALDGINPELVGSITRADGGNQVTLAGWPLYYYSKDTAPGQTNGQNVGGVWFAAAPDGKKAGVKRPALGTADIPSLGKVLTDGQGHTLYLFTKDHPWPMKTACDATCLQKWTPFGTVTAADAKAAGLDPKTLFTFTRPDGTKQESFNCWPAYTFKGDTNPGQANGQNVGKVWFAIKQQITVDRGRTVPAAKTQPGAPAAPTTASTVPSGGTSGSDGYGY